MKLNGNQIVVELPEIIKSKILREEYDPFQDGEARGYNAALAEVARMNPAMEVDEEMIKIILETERALFHDQTWLEFRTVVAEALASNPSAWLKRKDSFQSVENKKLRNGEPCNHPGCLSHVSHPCEGCGRVAGKYLS